MDIEDIKKKREGLMTNYNTLIDKRVELEKQLEVTSNEILTMRGAILLCNELVEDLKVEDDKENSALGSIWLKPKIVH